MAFDVCLNRSLIPRNEMLREKFDGLCDRIDRFAENDPVIFRMIGIVGGALVLAMLSNIISC